jgi:hypothetical protein
MIEGTLLSFYILDYSTLFQMYFSFQEHGKCEYFHRFFTFLRANFLDKTMLYWFKRISANAIFSVDGL